ncbi:MAG: helix-turn-helix domain-containing protein [bacterium]|nr:helix-turn-helix domain-containing protein [bacterium]
MATLEQELKTLGLGDYEARIYGVLLGASPASATYLARKCGLSRSSVYTTLAGLIAKGLVGTTYRNEVKQFIAAGQSALENMLRNERDSLEQKFRTLAGLEKLIAALPKPVRNIPQVVFFEGQEGLKRVYLSMMRQASEGSTLYLIRDEFVWQPDWRFIFEPEWHERIRRLRTENDIRMKLLVNDSPAERRHTVHYRSRDGLEFRFLPPKSSVRQFALYCIGDTVSILSMEKNNPVGIKIVNQHLAENLKSVFEAVWVRSKRISR